MQKSKERILLKMQFKKKNSEKSKTEGEQIGIGSGFQQGGGQRKAKFHEQWNQPVKRGFPRGCVFQDCIVWIL